MKDSILLENARREIARMGGLAQPEPRSSASAPSAIPHHAVAAFPHAPIAFPHVAFPHRAVVTER
jgi:hypothetical protein